MLCHRGQIENHTVPDRDISKHPHLVDIIHLGTPVCGASHKTLDVDETVDI